MSRCSTKSPRCDGLWWTSPPPASSSSCKSNSSSIRSTTSRTKPRPRWPGQRRSRQGGPLSQGGGPGADRRHGAAAPAAHRAGREAREDPGRPPEAGRRVPHPEKGPKAQYSAAKAVSSVDESTAGISKTFGDSGRSSSEPRTRLPRCRRTPARSTSPPVRGPRRRRRRHRRHPAGARQGREQAEVDKELAALKADTGTFCSPVHRQSSPPGAPGPEPAPQAALGSLKAAHRPVIRTGRAGSLRRAAGR